MKRFSILTAIFLLFLFLVRVAPAQAQTAPLTNDHTAHEEAEGKEVWEKLQAKQLECKNLTDDNFDVLGEYFMGQSIGNTERHAAMNQMMTSMMGEKGEKQMHIVTGKRLSGCESNAQVPQDGIGFIPMMPPLAGLAFLGGWMMGGGNPMMGFGGNNTMGGWNGFGILGWLPMLLFWILLILGVVALLRYLGGTTRGSDKRSSPLDILKERYAKGEIDKKEFEQMKKDLV